MDSLQASRIAGGNSAIGRREADFYPTPPEVTVAPDVVRLGLLEARDIGVDRWKLIGKALDKLEED